MKLRKLILHNVRRFSDKTVTLGPFGDGLTTITEENERGKSTFFDALHALFFHSYGANKKELRDLQPYSGGAVRIAAEIELDEGAYRIEKLFNLKKSGSSATITALETGTLIKQADDAENWIRDKILMTRKGPVGLLWVRQGTVGVDAAKSEEEGIDARRDVMSSVRGQIDAVTGGRRMDRILQSCKAELSALATKQGKAKAGSQWKEAEDLAEKLRQEKQDLQASVAALGHDLNLKKQVSKRLRELNNETLRASRLEAIKTTEAVLAAARDHDRKIQDADKDLQLLLNAAMELDRKIRDITDLQAKRIFFAESIDRKNQELEKARKAKTQVLEVFEQRQALIADCEGRRRSLLSSMQQARRDKQVLKHAERLVDLERLFETLQAPLDALARAEAHLQMPKVSQDDLDRLSDLKQKREIAIEKRKVHFSTFRVFADGAKAVLADKELSDGDWHLIDRPLEIMLPGFGAFHLQPAEGASKGLEDPEQLQMEYDLLLQSLGFESLRAAKQAFVTREKAVTDRKLAQTQINAFAPDGIDALRLEQQQLSQQLDCSPAQAADFLVEKQQSAAASPGSLEKALGELDDELETLREGLMRGQVALNDADGVMIREDVLLRQLLDDQAELPVQADEETQLDQLKVAKRVSLDKVENARSILQDLQQQAVDLGSAEIAYQRAVRADEEDRKEIHRQDKELARLNGAIEIQAEGAVEEKLAEVTGKLARVEERVAQFANHAAAIKLLIDHLEAARLQAQETYFEPVRNELLPLLRQLHAGADLTINADNLLIEAITRDGVVDKVDVLSGGAFEQIAILTRLAFARLFARQGCHVPIILDDALVHTDDERISTMFNMLAQIAKDQQIIVLSCRTRAFSDLGGTRVFITEN